jgi:heme exporter protein A
VSSSADRTPRGADGGERESTEALTPCLEVRALSCAAGYRLLFEDLSFDLHPGRWLRLTGPNGSGKTTLLRAIAGLVRPMSGSVCWYGRQRVAGNPEWHANMLFQGHAAGWKDGFGALYNLALQCSLDAGLFSDDATELSRLESLINRCGLEGLGALPYMRLSAGQRRRLSLARLAGASQPLWLLDEPTTALDAEGQGLFGRLLREHLVRGGCAVVATHLPIQCDNEPMLLDLRDHAGTATRENA